MSEYDKPHSYDVYEHHPATRPEQAQDFTGFAAHPPSYASEYLGTHAQAPSGLPSQASALSLIAPAQQYPGAHDRAYYAGEQPHYPAYLDSGPRQLPEVISYAPSQGAQGTKVTVYFRSSFDLDAPPQASIVMMFGQKRCDSVLSKTPSQGSPYQYALSADAPALASTGSGSESPQLPLSLMFEGSVAWQSPSLEFGNFTYLDHFSVDSPAAGPRKRKLSPLAPDRRSPPKKQSYHQLPRADSQPHMSSGQPVPPQASEYARPSISDPYSQTRRISQPEYGYGQALPRVQPQQFYAQPAAASAARLQTGQSQTAYNYYPSISSATRSPSSATVAGASKASQLLPSPASTNPPLIRTSTLQQSPTTPAPLSTTPQLFNPYAMYSANTKAALKIEGELNSMVENWEQAEWDAKRRLVQFRRSQQGSVITACFEPVSLEDRLPNSICVSCIWWEEKQECYVTSVDTISLLESLVAVRFTVEEKNRIRRNLEGFRPATVSKTKADSEDFFKLIMGFPNPKPRNIEKDVKVFPWRILATALKKIIGKYSASYSSTAGALHPAAAPSYGPTTGADAGMEQPQQQRPAASPRSTSSAATSHGHAYATGMTSQSYAPHTAGSAGMGLGPSAGPPADLRLGGQTPASWQQPQPQPQQHRHHHQHQQHQHHHTQLAALYPSPGTTGNPELAATAGAAAPPLTARTPSSWEFGSYLSGAAAASQYQFGSGRMPSLPSGQAAVPEARFVPLHDYEHQQGQPTSNAP